MPHNLYKTATNTTLSNLTKVQPESLEKSYSATTTSEELEQIHRSYFDLVRISNETSKLSNWSSHLYAELFKTISKMGELPEGEDLYLEPDATIRAISVLGFIKEQMNLQPPRIINQDGEAVSFTWDIGNLKRYLTVSEDEVDLMHLSKRLPVRCEEVLSEGKDIDYQNLLVHLTEMPRSTSAESVD